MRQIKFRGKDIETGEWLYGYLVQPIGQNPRIYVQDVKTEGVASFFVYDVEESTVGQFIGLLDKNKNEIYEGDIVRNKEIGGYWHEHLGVVRYYEEGCCFGIDVTTTSLTGAELILFSPGENSFNDGYCTITYTNEYEVLGNIHDNPEFLKNK